MRFINITSLNYIQKGVVRMTNKEKLEKLEQIKQKHLGYEFPTHED